MAEHASTQCAQPQPEWGEPKSGEPKSGEAPPVASSSAQSESGEPKLPEAPPAAPTSTRGASARGRPWTRWVRVGALVLGFASLFWVRSIVDTRDKTVGARRAELGVIELRHGEGPTGVKGWVATFNIDRPVTRVWRILSDCQNFPKILKGVASCRLLRQEGRVKYHRMELTHPENAYMETRTEYDLLRHSTAWRMTRGSFRAAEGGIRLRPHPEHRGWTQVTYAYYLNISVLLPESFEVPRVHRSVRRMAEEIQSYFSEPHPAGGSPGVGKPR